MEMKGYDVNMVIKSMELTEIENMNVKIDTGCPYTSSNSSGDSIQNQIAFLMCRCKLIKLYFI